MLGNGRCEALCIDGIKRLSHIRGKMHKKVWIAAGDIILVGLRDYQDDKADVILKYQPDEARLLKAYGELPDNIRLNEGIAGGMDEEGPTSPPPPWGARWPATHRTHRSSSPLGSSLASTAQDPPVLLPPGELAGQHRTRPTGPPPHWGSRWPAPHRTHRSSSPLGSSLASTAQDPPALLPPGELAGQHRTGPTGPPPPLGSSLASTAQDPPVLLPPQELAGQHRTGPTGPPPP
ncbi:unnamed protein product [Closterium sp. NIES-65]|nr:unnamed protein product [Closterium sp. NIES-65]